MHVQACRIIKIVVSTSKLLLNYWQFVEHHRIGWIHCNRCTIVQLNRLFFTKTFQEMLIYLALFLEN